MEDVVQKQLAQQIVVFNNERLLQSATAETKQRKMVLEEERVQRWIDSLEQDGTLMELEFKANIDAMWAPVDAMMQRNLEKKAILEERRNDLNERRRVLEEERRRFAEEKLEFERGHARLVYDDRRPPHAAPTLPAPLAASHGPLEHDSLHGPAACSCSHHASLCGPPVDPMSP